MLGHAHAVSIKYTRGDTTSAERAIAERLAGVALQPAFGSNPVEVHLSLDRQAVEIGRHATNAE